MSTTDNTLSGLITEFQNYVVSPLNAFGLGGFVFDVAGESIAHLSADITDHYTEDNRALQDHIAIHPKKITLKGYVGEVVYYGDGNGQSVLQQAVQKLTELSSFLPTLSSAATQIQESIATPTNSNITLPDASNIYGLVQNLLGATGNQARQQNAYTYFKALMNQGILMGVQTPWEFMTNMAIETITAIQPEGSIFMTDFQVTLKEIRIARVQTTAYTANPSSSSIGPQGSQLQGAAVAQASPQVPLGNVPGVSLPTSLLPGVQSQIGGVDDLMPLANQAALTEYRQANGMPTPPIDNYYNNISSVFFGP